MNVELKFDFDTYTVYLPDGYIFDASKLQNDFLEWMQEKPECITQDKNGNLGFSYDADTFLKYINEVILANSGEKAYFAKNPTNKALYTLKF